jgi:hypothetical protein
MVMVKIRDDLNVGPREKAIEAIKAGKTEEALKYLDEAYEQFHYLHDRYSNDISRGFALLAEAYGEEWLKGYIGDEILEAFTVRFEPWKKLTPEEIVERVCAIHRAHYSEFHVEEDDEKFTVALTACNAGGRLIRDGLAKKENAVTKKAYPWAFNMVGLPYYCIHTSFTNQAFKNLGIKVEVKWGRQYDDQGNKVNEPCRYIIYK